MDKQKLTHTCEYFLRLVGNGIGVPGRTPLSEKPEDAEWKDLLLLSQKHSLAAVTYRALKDLPAPPDAETLAAWEKAYGTCVHADIQQLYAWEEIRDYFTEKGFRLLPLKGLRLKYLYPETALRLMGDLDIFYEKERFPELKAGMESLGYTFQVKSLGGNHQIFDRPPVTNVEMHSALLPAVSPFADYYADVWGKALPTEEKNVFRFSVEDEYIYFLIHAYKHFQGAGGGVRTIADFYLFRKKYAESMDRTYIENELRKAESAAARKGEAPESLSRFEQKLSDISGRWFGKKVIVNEEDFALFTDGVYGKIENLWEHELQKKGRAKYLFGRLFPSYAVMKTGYPVLAKLPFLLPFCWIARLFRGLFRRRKQIAREYRYVSRDPQKREKDN